jgi:NADH/NAD ratio-sensing transcriptional regulator Rex
MAVVKAYVYLGDTLVSTGLAYEKNGEGYVNKTSHLENCETSAIGRALANFNYAGSKRPSREEMQKASPRDAIIKQIGEKVKDLPEEEKAELRERIKKSDLEALKEILQEVA